jgi:hypothetical protein
VRHPTRGNDERVCSETQERAFVSIHRNASCCETNPGMWSCLPCDQAIARARVSAFAGCGHGALHALGGNGPRAVVYVDSTKDLIIMTSWFYFLVREI